MICLLIKKFTFPLFIAVFISASFLLCPLLINATELNKAGLNSFNDNLNKVAPAAGYDTTGDNNSVEGMVSTIITVVLSFLGIIFLGLIIYAGYNWMTAAGEEAKVTKAKETLTRAIIGIIITVSAYAISYFVMKKITENSLNSSSEITCNPDNGSCNQGEQN